MPKLGGWGVNDPESHSRQTEAVRVGQRGFETAIRRRLHPYNPPGLTVIISPEKWAWFRRCASMQNLQPISPKEAVDWYLDEREHEVSEKTIQAHGYRLGHFVRWCQQEGIDNMNDLTGRDFSRFKNWRRDDGDLNNVTLHTQMSTFKVFIKWAQNLDAVPQGMFELVRPPSLDPDEDVRKNALKAGRAKAMLDYQKRFHYASQEHVALELIWNTGLRLGGVRTLDTGDFSPRKGELDVRHRPESDTPLKMKEKGERIIYLPERLVEIIQAYIDHHRHNVEDKYGRSPLITTSRGRPARNTIRNMIYRSSHPCQYEKECPHGEDPTTCPAQRNFANSSECPSAVNPHAVRKGAITHALKNKARIESVSGRMNVSPDILKKHYDQRTKHEAMESRKDDFSYLEDDL